MSVVEKKVDTDTKIADNKSKPSNESTVKINRLVKSFDKHSSTYIFVLTSIATVLGVIIKALEMVYHYAKYKELGIPAWFLKQDVSIGDFLPFLVLLITFFICTFVLVLAISYYYQLKAYLELEKKLQLDSRKKLQTFFIKYFFPVFGCGFIAGLNYPSVYLCSDIKSVKIIVVLLLLIFLVEFYCAKTVYDIIKNNRLFEQENKEVKINKPDNMSEEEYEKALQEFIVNESFVNYKTLLRIITVLIVIGCLVHLSASMGKSSATNKNQPILSSDGSVKVVLDMYDDKYIVSPANIENNILVISNRNQMLIESENLEYSYVEFDEVRLETDTEK